jgi:hypothetical protein
MAGAGACCGIIPNALGNLPDLKRIALKDGEVLIQEGAEVSILRLGLS